MTGQTREDLCIRHAFDAPVEEIWRSWTEPELLEQWWGPHDFSCPSARMDFREGGTSVVAMQAPDHFGGQTTYSGWTYSEIEPLRRICYVHNLTDEAGSPIDPRDAGLPADFPQQQRHVITFERTGSGTEVTVTEYDWPVGQLQVMAELGMQQCLEKLAALLPLDE